MGFSPESLTLDRFLGGRLVIHQPVSGYRAGVDPVLLAAWVPAQTGQSVLELGCGAGVASLCLGRRVSGVRLTGVELQAEYADLARRNAAENAIELRVIQADLRALPPAIRAMRFDHIIANPPYYQRHRGTAARDQGRDVALAGDTPLRDWAEVAARRLVPKGYLSLIQDTERLPEVLAALLPCLGSIEVQPLAARKSRAAHRVLVRARKGGRAAFKMHAPIVLHSGDRHEKDAESYTPLIGSVLRDGAGLPGSGG